MSLFWWGGLCETCSISRPQVQSDQSDIVQKSYHNEGTFDSTVSTWSLRIDNVSRQESSQGSYTWKEVMMSQNYSYFDSLYVNTTHIRISIFIHFVLKEQGEILSPIRLIFDLRWRRVSFRFFRTRSPPCLLAPSCERQRAQIINYIICHERFWLKPKLNKS